MVRDDGAPSRSPAFAEDALRAFLECGVHRFGVVRFRCRGCGRDAFVAFSCRRRMACPSCDSKRAAVESAIAMDGLLPMVAYRQWVLTLPKRLRYFVHRNPALAGEISRILGKTLTRFYRQRAWSVGRVLSEHSAAPSQVLVVQRFGERVNLHVHFHVVTSDGVFALGAEGSQDRGLVFVTAAGPSAEEIVRLRDALRRKILRRMLRLKAVPEESALEMLSRPHGGFSLDASVLVDAGDRRGLERLLRYVLRPAVALKRLSYLPERALVRYRMRKGEPGVLEWEAVEFMRRFASLIPPPRRHLIRYCGALGPRSKLRQAVAKAAREKVSFEELLAGKSWFGDLTLGVGRAIESAGRNVTASARSWAACLKRVFEIDPIFCQSCGLEMKPVAAIMADSELNRILAHLGLPGDFPKTKPARSPPQRLDEQTQIDPRVELWEGIDEGPQTDWAAA